MPSGRSCAATALFVLLADRRPIGSWAAGAGYVLCNESRDRRCRVRRRAVGMHWDSQHAEL